MLTVSAQTTSEDFKKLSDTDTTDLRLLATYDGSVRKNLLQVCVYPELITRLSDLQKSSSEAFKNSIASLDQETQSKIWNITRYDQLISNLENVNAKSGKIDGVLKDYPEDIHDDAKWLVKQHPSVLHAIDSISKNFNSRFQVLKKEYPQKTQQAITSLLTTPEIINILYDNMRLAVYLGDLYKKDPKIIEQQFDSLNTVVELENIEEREALNKAVSADPQAAAEMKKSAEAFAESNGYSESEYKSGDPAVVTEYVYVPYPYWSGYPWWFEYNYWYPYPYWYHWGFYYQGSVMMWIHPPSWYYMNWYFYDPYNYYYYPHLCNVYLNNYYYGPRRSHGSNTQVVNQWVRKNAPILPENFEEASHLRADRIREIGKAAIDRDQFIKANPGKTISNESFIKENRDHYPALNNTKSQTVYPTEPRKSTPETHPMEMPPKRSSHPVYSQPVQPKSPPGKTPTIKSPRQSQPMKSHQPPVSRPAPQRSPVAKPQQRN